MSGTPPAWNARTRRTESSSRLVKSVQEARKGGSADDEGEDASTPPDTVAPSHLATVPHAASSKESLASGEAVAAAISHSGGNIEDIIAEKEERAKEAEVEAKTSLASPRAVGPRPQTPRREEMPEPAGPVEVTVQVNTAEVTVQVNTRLAVEEKRHRHRKDEGLARRATVGPSAAPVPTEAGSELEKLRAENARLQAELRKKDQIIVQLQNKLGAVLASAAMPAAPQTTSEDSRKKTGKEGKLGGQFSYEAVVRHKQQNRTGLHDLEAQRELSHREKLVLEVITTEQSYVTGLALLSHVYLKGLLEAARKDGGNKLRKEDVTSVFGNIEQLHLLNAALLSELEERVAHWAEPGQDRIGDLLAQYAPRTKPYGRFGGHYNESLKRIEELSRTNSVWRRTLEELDEQVSKVDGLSLAGYFIMPVQRLPRYVLLIRDLLKQTPETHRDHKELTEAATRMAEAAATLNESIRAAESQVHMFEILERGGGFDRLVSHPKQYYGQRYWLRDDELAGALDLGPAPFHDLDDVAATEGRLCLLPSSKRKVELLVFNDIIVLAPLVGKKVPPQEYHQPTALLWLLPVTPELLDECRLDDTERGIFSVACSLLLRGPENRWLLAFQTASKKAAWVADVAQVMRLGPQVELEGDGVREGTYEFRHAALGAYEGEWQHGAPHGKGTLLCSPTSASTAIYDGHWNAKYRAGVGMLGDRLVGWKASGTGVRVADEHGLWDEAALSERDWQRLLTGAQVVAKAPGERFIEQGKQNTSLFRVRRGQIRVEKAVEGSSRKQVLVTLGPGTVLGDTSVIPSMKAATADVLADSADVELEAISISILFGLFRSDPGLSMRFYRQMARKLATQLRGLHMPKPPADDESASERDSDEEDAPSAPAEPAAATPSKDLGSAKLRDVDAATLALLQKFHLPITEVLLKSSECVLKAVLKKVGAIHVFQNHICFDCTVFGMSTADVYPLRDIISLEVDKKAKGLKLKTKDGKKAQFASLKDLDAFMSVLQPVYEEAVRKDEAAPKDDKTDKKGARKKTKREGTLKRSNTRTGLGLSAQGQGEGAVTMTPEDWALLLEGARLVPYADGTAIIEEGMAHQRIYQVAQGRCAITKRIDGGSVTLGHLESGALFGEMTFLEKGNATASVTAEGEAQIYIIEGHFINILFVDHPHLAGRFYSYLATILAQRLSDREAQIHKQLQLHKAERRARRKARDQK